MSIELDDLAWESEERVSLASSAAHGPAAAQGQQLRRGCPWAEALGEGVADLRRSFLVEVEKLQALLDTATGREAGDFEPKGGPSTRPLAPICEQGDQDTLQAPAPLESAEAPFDKESAEWLGLATSAISAGFDRAVTPFFGASDGGKSTGGGIGGNRVSTFAELSAEIVSEQATRHLMPSPSTKSSTPKGFRSSQSGMSGVTTMLYGDDRRAQQVAKDMSLGEVERAAARSMSMKPEPPNGAKTMVNSLCFEAAGGVAILTNSLLIGIEIQYRTIHMTTETPLPFYVINHCFAILFTLELLTRMKAYGLRELFITHGLSWAWMDLFIVAAALLEMLFDLLFLTGSESSQKPAGINGMSEVRISRILRVTRLVRTLRIQRLIRHIAPLRTLVLSIAGTLRSLMWAMVLLILMMYVVGLVVSQGVLDFCLENSQDLSPELNEGLQEYWISLDTAMFTLFQSFTGGVSWRDTIIPLEEVSLAFAWIVTAFISFVFFAMLNVMTGVFCSNAIETAQRNPEVIAASLMVDRHVYSENLRNLFKNMDEDDSGLITLSELENLLNNEMLNAHLRALGLDVGEAWTLFRLIDTDRSGVIEIDEFLRGCERLKGGARGIDLATMGFEIRNLGKKLAGFMKRSEAQLEALACHLDSGTTYAPVQTPPPPTPTANA